MRKSLTFEAAKMQHRRRARTLIFASIAALVLGSTVSGAVASAWAADRHDAAETRFQDAVAQQHALLEATVHNYRRVVTVTQGFFEVREPTSDEFLTFTNALELPDARPSVIALQFIQRARGRTPTDVAYPVTMVAPRSASPTLLGSNLADDASARAALETVGKDGGVTMTPPEPNLYRQLRMQLIAPIHRRLGQRHPRSHHARSGDPRPACDRPPCVGALECGRCGPRVCGQRGHARR